ncbi:MAG: hypothetical protein HQ488_04165 [Parcubacteria group bacterium]|nr:hypothetical protein [Parcubacteria group bacterium]
MDIQIRYNWPNGPVGSRVASVSFYSSELDSELEFSVGIGDDENPKIPISDWMYGSEFEQKTENLIVKESQTLLFQAKKGKGAPVGFWYVMSELWPGDAQGSTLVEQNMRDLLQDQAEGTNLEENPEEEEKGE